MYDSIIIGAGPAGLTASLYLARKEASILLISEDVGGQASLAGTVENYPSQKSISGNDLMRKIHKQVESLNAPVAYEQVKSVRKKESVFKVLTNQKKYSTKTVIISSGKTHRRLNVPGEEELTGRGVAYCATCDAPNFKDLSVAVIGGGNSAADTVLELSKYANRIYMVDINDKFIADAIMLDKVKKLDFVKLLNNKKTISIKGDQLVSAIELEDIKTKKKQEIEVAGVFVTIGWQPSTNFKIPAKLNKKAEIVIDKNCHTNIPGFFAAGDVTDLEAKQMIVAAGEGAKAAIAAANYLVKAK